MFTGIVEEVGKIVSISPISGGKRVTVYAPGIAQDLKVSDSIAVSGVCLTAVSVSSENFTVDVVGDTLHKTTLSHSKKGHSVNLERALRLSDRLGGHFVQGHVNGVGKITRFERLGENWELEIHLNRALLRYVVAEGSIAVDGISLTVAELGNEMIRISVIPHTYRNTTMADYQQGNQVNIETDFLGKYVEKFITQNKSESRISATWLKDLGY